MDPNPLGEAFSHSDVALLHETTEAEGRRVAADVLKLPAEGPFPFDDLLRINRILGPPPGLRVSLRVRLLVS